MRKDVMVIEIGYDDDNSMPGYLSRLVYPPRWVRLAPQGVRQDVMIRL